MSALEEVWVSPFYMNILGGQYSVLRGKEKAAFVRRVKQALAAITEDIAARLLTSSDWRNQITGSWFCGLKGWKQFTDAIGASLIASRVCFAGQGYAFALACFGDAASVGYLTEYLDQYLTQPDCWYDQGNALSALSWIDAHHGGAHTRAYLKRGGLWDSFTVNKNKAWRFKTVRNEFWREIRYCKQNFVV